MTSVVETEDLKGTGLKRSTSDETRDPKEFSNFRRAKNQPTINDKQMTGLSTWNASNYNLFSEQQLSIVRLHEHITNREKG
jgi:hypothetical protein